METFGEKEFEPVNKPESLKMTDEQSALLVENRTQMGQLQRQYIIEEERSFTIIAFTIPEVGDCFEELFRETIQINTLDYKKISGSSRPSLMPWIRQIIVKLRVVTAIIPI